jgi:hypothetical protein
MPMDKKRYPPEWAEISYQVKYEAEFKCEQCHIPNGAVIQRLISDPFTWRLNYRDGDTAWSKPRKVTLTVHHIGAPYPDGRKGDPHDKMDNRSENLICLCNRCHLLADLKSHIANAKRNRAQKMSAGTLPLNLDL